MDLSKNSIEDLKNLIDNHKRLNATNLPLFKQALQEYNKRKGGGLDFEKTLKFVLEAAHDGKFISYIDVANANNADWNSVRFSIGNHLWALVDYAHANGWPLLSSIIVNKQNLETGEMHPSTLTGYINAAKELGYNCGLTEGDNFSFLKDQQQKVFEWARISTKQKEKNE